MRLFKIFARKTKSPDNAGTADQESETPLRNIELSERQKAVGWEVHASRHPTDRRQFLHVGGPLYPLHLIPDCPDGFRCVLLIASLKTETDKIGSCRLTFIEIRPNTDTATVSQAILNHIA